MYRPQVRWCLVLFVLSLVSATQVRVYGETLDEWVASERETAQRKLLGAIGRNGAVVASPDESTPGQDYYFHWIRDAALTMDVVVSLYLNAPDVEDHDEYGRLLKNYVRFSRKNQTAPQPMGFMGLGEPKFFITGTIFTGSWGRPQNDGPALRSITLCRWSQKLLDEIPSNPLVLNDIKPIVLDDLNFVKDHCDDLCTDLWEEVRGKHFYERMVQRRALIEGAALLTRIGDTTTPPALLAKIPGLEAAITSHFDAGNKKILATLNVDGSNNGKTSQLDAAAILGMLHGETPATPFFSPIDDRILATATALRDKFSTLYPINSNSTDSEGQKMELAIGRYPEDTYDGAQNHGGNPWFLTTAAFAEHAYRARDRYTSVGTIHVTDRSLAYLIAARDAGGSSAAITAGTSIPASDARFTAITTGLKVTGDRYLRRIRLHAADDGSLSEQYQKSSGFMTSAVDLTWSYAAILTSFFHR